MKDEILEGAQGRVASILCDLYQMKEDPSLGKDRFRVRIAIKELQTILKVYSVSSTQGRH